MSYVTRLENGRSCPRIVCDHCGEAIIGHGNAMFLVREECECAPILHTHKGCCYDFDNAHEEQYGCQDLSMHLVYLLENNKIDLGMGKRQVKMLNRLLKEMGL